MNKKFDRQTFLVFLQNHLYLIFMFISFFSVELLLRYYTNIIAFVETFNVTTNLFNVFWIFIIMCFITIIPYKVGRIVYSVMSLIMTLLCSAQYIYFQIFNKFFWINDAVVAKEGTDYASYVIDHFDWRFLMILMSGLVFMSLTLLTYRKQKSSNSPYLFRGITVAISMIMLSFILPQSLGSKVDTEEGMWDGWRDPRKVYESFADQNRYIETAGYYSYTFRDIYNTIFPNKKDLEEMYEQVDAFYAEKEIPSTNAYTGKFIGKNLIMVMMESIDEFTISEKYTPTLSYMREHGLSFNQHHAPIFGAGGTFNSEFTTLTGFHSPNMGNAAYTYGKNAFPNSLPNLLKESGYRTTSFHFNNGSFYNRTLMHSAFGFDQHVSFLDEGGDKQAVEFDAYAANTDSIYKQMTDNTPFFDFYITYSAHLPYNNTNNICSVNQEVYSELVDTSLGEEEQCIYLQAKATDDFFATLLTRLYEDSILEDTVIVAFTDHHLYGLNDQQLLASLQASENDIVGDKVPFIIYDYENEFKQSIDKVSNTSDILPTVLNLFGFNKSLYYLGSDVFDDSYKGYSFHADGSWYDGEIWYQGDEKTTPYIEQMSMEVTKRMEINDMVLNSDYFNYLNKNK